MKPKTDRFIAIVLLFLMILGVVVYYKWRPLTQQYVYHGDIAMAYYSYHRLHHPDAFPNDLIADYSETVMVAPFVKMLFWLFSLLCDPLIVAKWIWVLFFPLSIYLLFRLGESLGDHWSGFTIAGLVAFATFNKLALDTPGSSADMNMAFFAGFLWAMSKEYFGIVGVILLATNLSNPLPSMILLLALFLYMFRFEPGLGLFRLKPRQSLWLGITIAVTVGQNLFKYAFKDSNVFGDFVSRAQFLQMPEFRPGGRFPLTGLSFRQWLTSDIAGLGLNVGLIFLIILIVVGLAINGKKGLKIGRASWAFFAAGLILFVLALVFIPRLHKPTRYFFLPTMLILGCLAGNNLWYLRKRIDSPVWRNAIMILPVLLLLILSIPGYRLFYIWAPDHPLYDFLSTLPKDSMIAAHPGLANHIPVFSKRSTLVTSELTDPFYNDYYKQMSTRTRDFFRAYYAKDEKTVEEFCKKYRLSDIVVNSYHFSDDYLRKGKRYFAPFDSDIEKITAKPKQSYLLNLPDGKKAFSYRYTITRPILRDYAFHYNGADPYQYGPEPGAAYRSPIYEMYVVPCSKVQSAN